MHRFVRLNVDSDTVGVVSRLKSGIAGIFELSRRLQVLSGRGIRHAHRFSDRFFYVPVPGAFDSQSVQSLQYRKRHHQRLLQRFRNSRHYRPLVRILDRERNVQQAAEIGAQTASVEEQFAKMWQVVQAGEIVVEGSGVRIAHEVQDHEHVEPHEWQFVVLAFGDDGEFALHEDVRFERRPWGRDIDEPVLCEDLGAFVPDLPITG